MEPHPADELHLDAMDGNEQWRVEERSNGWHILPPGSNIPVGVVDSLVEGLAAVGYLKAEQAKREEHQQRLERLQQQRVASAVAAA